MKNSSKYLLAIITIAIVIIGIYVRFYKLNEIKLIKIGEIYREEPIDEGWWFPVYDNNDENLKSYGIKIPTSVDFQKNNLVISGGREIQKLNYMRKMNFPYTKSHFAKATFKKDLNENTWYIYKIEKIEVSEDQKGDFNTIEK